MAFFKEFFFLPFVVSLSNEEFFFLPFVVSLSNHERRLAEIFRTSPKRGLAMQQPHILLITSDQHRGDCLGINGHPVVSAPNLDYLAASGTNFPVPTWRALHASPRAARFSPAKSR